jgi:hypothetical protein
VWLKQEYIATLRDFGEWRVILIDSEIQYVIHTIPCKSGDGTQVWDSRVVHGFYSLQGWG